MIESILLILLIVILSAKLLGALFERIGLDSAVGELLAGIILGPSLLNLVEASSIESFAVMGSILILFLAGIKQRDIDRVYKDKTAIELGFLLLFVVGIIMTLFFYFIAPSFGIEINVFQALVLGLAFAIVDVGLPAKLLLSKNLMGLPVGKATIRAAIINIVLGLLLFTVITLFVKVSLISISLKILGIIGFVILSIFLVFFFSKISRYVMRLHIEEAEISLAFVLILILAYFTEVIGFTSILGAFIAGVFLSHVGFAQTNSFSSKIKSIAFGLFIPLFFVWFGLEVNLFEIWKNIWLAIIIFVLYVSLRFVIVYSYMKVKKLTAPGFIASSMVSVDVESLVILIVAIQIGIFSDNLAINLFAPSVLFSTLLIVIATTIFSKRELKKPQKATFRYGSNKKFPQKKGFFKLISLK